MSIMIMTPKYPCMGSGGNKEEGYTSLPSQRCNCAGCQRRGFTNEWVLLFILEYSVDLPTCLLAYTLVYQPVYLPYQLFAYLTSSHSFTQYSLIDFLFYWLNPFIIFCVLFCWLCTTVVSHGDPVLLLSYCKEHWDGTYV